MSGKRSCYEHKHRFLHELLMVYRKEIAHGIFINREEVMRRVCANSFSRFWVSEDRAIRVIQKMIKSWGECPVKRGREREMYTEIYRRTIALLKEDPDQTVEDAVTRVVNAPSPKLYLCPRMVYQKINEAKRLCSEHRRPKP